MDTVIYTIGHSNHTLEVFVRLLQQHSVTALCDVRSSPHSKYNPQFNYEALKSVLPEIGIAYVFLGKELGARSGDPNCYVGDKVQYEKLAKTFLFQQGLDRVDELAQPHRVSLMCAEKDPLTCHRTILVARHLVERGHAVQHILDDGTIETHDDAVQRLRRELGIHEADLFRSDEELVDDAYRIQGERIAFTLPDAENALHRAMGEDYS